MSINIQEKSRIFSKQNFLFLTIIFAIGIIIRIYYLPLDVPIILDGQFYFWYANDMSILGKIPTEYNAHNNLWSSILSIFFSINQTNEILDYMNLQRVISIIISTLTIFPVFYLCKKFVSNNLAILGSAFFVMDPRIIINSLLGITEPIYFLFGITIIAFSLNKNKKFYYISFGLAAILSLIRYEGILILIPLTVAYFWKFRVNKESIIKYGLCLLIFLLVIFPMVDARIQSTGEDGILSHIFSGGKYVTNTFSGDYEKQDREKFIQDGIINSIKFLGWITIPIWILFLPYGILIYFKKLNQQKIILLLFSIILILPAIYAYSRDISETRYLYILFPLFSIISLYTIEKLTKQKYCKFISSLILAGIIIASIGWLEYKGIDKDHEREAFILSLKVKEITKGVNEYYPESTYLEFIDQNKQFPKMKNEIFQEHSIFSTIKYQNIKELILSERNNGLTHIVADNNHNQRPEYIKEVFENENKFEFLKKVYDSNQDGFNYHIKIFEINNEKFDDYVKKNKSN